MMPFPISIYEYQKLEDSFGYLECMKKCGREVPELSFILTKGRNVGKEVIEIAPMTRKKNSRHERTPLGLKNPRISFLYPEIIEYDDQGRIRHRPTSISNLYEPDVTRPGEGYGTILCTDYVFLSRRNQETGELKIMVYEGFKGQEEALFLAWGHQGVSEVLPYNRITFTLNSDNIYQKGDEND